jgi:hypothetical protein
MPEREKASTEGNAAASLSALIPSADNEPASKPSIPTAWRWSIKRLFIVVQHGCGQGVAVTTGAGAHVLTSGQRWLLYGAGTNIAVRIEPRDAQSLTAFQHPKDSAYQST